MSNIILKPKKPTHVSGSACAQYMDRAIGFGYHGNFGSRQNIYYYTDGHFGYATLNGETIYKRVTCFNHLNWQTSLVKWKHNPASRKVGLIKKRYSDGGIQVAILGSDRFSALPGNTNIDAYKQRLGVNIAQEYESNPLTNQYKIKPPYISNYPEVVTNLAFGEGDYGSKCLLAYNQLSGQPDFADFDSFNAWEPHLMENHSEWVLGDIWSYNGQVCDSNRYDLTTDSDTTLNFGVGYEREIINGVPYDNMLFNDPLAFFSGNLYEFVRAELVYGFISMLPGLFLDGTSMNNWSVPLPSTQYLVDGNLTSIPYNLLLVENMQDANLYLNQGIIPDTAILYPLDWEHLPAYEATDPDDGEDAEDKNTPDDNNRDTDENLPVTPTYTPARLSNYNWYWLNAQELSDFIDWFWNDVGDISDWTDLVDKIKGLYNDLASAVLMVRYMPVDVGWIGGTGGTGNIKVGMVEKSGSYTQISDLASPDVQPIGHIHIPKNYDSFVDLAPYAELSLYLPYYGIVSLDVDILTGHDLYVKALYDHLNGTIQYFLYYDNRTLINTYIAKMAVDIPITLQSKNDRDSAIFSNVSNALGGLISAGAGIASGNPIGIALGATQGVSALTSGSNASAPLKVMGTVGETGAFYAPQKCMLYHRRAVITKPSSWKQNVGEMCSKTLTLGNLSGFTTCYNPRVRFTNAAPTQDEINEIYDYLEKGVIL